ncbi:hypothetical protein FA09DRAFT_291545, partial [Tilletiopsis washingtonensis]
GISAATGEPFDPPVAFRAEARPRANVTEKQTVLTGKCASCPAVQWRSATGDSHSLRRIFWFKHAQRCHKGRPRIEGAGSPFVQDAV